MVTHPLHLLHAVFPETRNVMRHISTRSKEYHMWRNTESDGVENIDIGPKYRINHFENQQTGGYVVQFIDPKTEVHNLTFRPRSMLHI